MIHKPVLLESVLQMVKDIAIRDALFVDATFGRGGHTREILKTRSDFSVLGLDCDAEAVSYGEEHFASEISQKRLKIVRSNFTKAHDVLMRENTESKSIAGVLLDLGVSSPQLDEGRRGFSFYHDGPLDMRMDQSLEMTAADLVNDWDDKALNDLFQNYGEVRRPFRVTEKIIETRRATKFSTTGELSQLIEKTEGWRKKGHHPATQYFQALRMEVNQELAVVEKILPIMVNELSSRGRLLVITFHSLEDRLVKTLLKKFCEEEQGILINKKVIQATWDEKKKNPRARSAKLRVFEKK